MAFTTLLYTMAIILLPCKNLLLRNNIPFLESVPDTEAKCLPADLSIRSKTKAEVRRTQAGMLVPEYISKKRYTDAETVLNNLPKDNLEKQKKDEYYKVHIDLGKTDRIPTDMIPTEKTTVEQVALSETEISYNAKAMLHFWFNEKYEPELGVLSAGSNKMLAQENDNLTKEQIPEIISTDNLGKLYPNPANDKLMMNYNINENEYGFIEIYNVMGILVVKEKLLWNKNSLEINAERLDNGVYFYETLIDGKPVVKDKLLIIRK